MLVANPTGQINVEDFDLAATLRSGQAFRWHDLAGGGFVGVIGDRVWRVKQDGNVLTWQTVPAGNPAFLENAARHYFGLDVELKHVVSTFPQDDAALQAAVRRHWGLRILRQEPWECLASFMASATKQIVQIRQIIELLTRRHGDRLTTRWGEFYSFPSTATVAGLTERELRDCKLGFRAPNLLKAARMARDGVVNLDQLPGKSHEEALCELMRLPGVGEKIGNCVLLFGCGFDNAFPVDVWVARALCRLYFGGDNKAGIRKARAFASRHFGPYAGWAQQYLFCDERRRDRDERIKRS